MLIVTQSIRILQLGIDSPNFDSEISMAATLHDRANYLIKFISVKQFNTIQLVYRFI